MTDSASKAIVLITGSSGFIGTNLIEALSGTFPDLINMDIQPPMNPEHARYLVHGDILDPDRTVELFKKHRPTHVVHFAARTDCDEGATLETGYRANTEGTANVLRAIKEAGTVKRLVMTSSQFVFNKKDRLPEGDQDYAPVTIYGRSKIITEKLTREAGLDCCWTIVRPTNVWGPWHIRHTRQFFRILRAGLYFHPGRQPVIRSYAYVGNVVDQILRILTLDEAKVHGKTLYVGDAPIDIFDWVDGFSKSLNGRPVRVIPQAALKSVAAVGDFISKVTRKEFFITSSRFRSMTDPYLTPMDKTFDVLGPPKYDLTEGIRLTTEWLKKFQGAK